MVAVWKFIALAAAIVSAVPVAQEPGIKVRDTADVVKVSVLESSGLEPRQQPKARARLMWSPQGRMLFTLALNLPTAVRQVFYEMGAAGPAAQLVRDFLAWCQANAHNVYMELIEADRIGGVYSDDSGPYSTYGIGIQLDTSTLGGPHNIRAVQDAFYSWVGQGGGLLQIIARANDFIDLRVIGAGERKMLRRGDDDSQERRSLNPVCHNPKSMNLLKYGAPADPNGNNLKWAKAC